MDIYPTLCDLCGIDIPSGLDGKSLKPLLLDTNSSVKDCAISQFNRVHCGKKFRGYALRTDRYRYIEWLSYDTGAVEYRELYDHQNDPDENENLASKGKNTATMDELSAKLWHAIPKPAAGGAFSVP